MLEAKDVKGKIDFAIITIKIEEYEAVLQRLQVVDHIKGRRTYCLANCQTNSGGIYQIAVARCWAQGPSQGRGLAESMIEDLDPQWFLLVGIAGGVPSDDFSLGDVLLATEVHDFSIMSAIYGKPMQYSSGGGPMHPKIRDYLATVLPSISSSLEGWNTESSIGMPKPQINLSSNNFIGDRDWKSKVRKSLNRHFGSSSVPRPPLYLDGAIASSGILVKDPQMLQDWLQGARHLQAMEMELTGVYDAAQRVDRVYPILAIRGISDIVGYRRHPDWTLYACHSAAAFTSALLNIEPIPPRCLVSSIVEDLVKQNQSIREKPDKLTADIMALVRNEPLDAQQVASSLGITKKMASNLLKVLLSMGQVDISNGVYSATEE